MIQREYLVHITRSSGAIIWQYVVSDFNEKDARLVAEKVAKNYEAQWCGGEYFLKLERLDSWLRVGRYRGAWRKGMPGLSTTVCSEPLHAGYCKRPEDA